jgi:hypothetical protein
MFCFCPLLLIVCGVLADQGTKTDVAGNVIRPQARRPNPPSPALGISISTVNGAEACTANGRSNHFHLHPATE